VAALYLLVTPNKIKQSFAFIISCLVPFVVSVFSMLKEKNLVVHQISRGSVTIINPQSISISTIVKVISIGELRFYYGQFFSF